MIHGISLKDHIRNEDASCDPWDLFEGPYKE